MAQLANSIPSKMLINQHDTKYAFRKAANRHLPEDWAKRPKLGFPVPVKTWLQEDKYYQKVKALFSEDWVNDIFDQAKILQLLQDNYEDKIDGRRQVWNIFTFLTWYKLYFIDFDNTLKKYEHLQPDVQEFTENGTLI